MNFLSLLELPFAPAVYDVASFPFVTLSMLTIKGVFEREKVRTILDVGSGTGSGALLLGKSFTVTSIEPSGNMRDWAKFKGVQSIAGSVQNLPDSEYDAVMANFLLRHLPPESLDAVLTSFDKHVKTGGLLVLTDLLLPVVGPEEGQRQFLGVLSLYNPMSLSEAVEKKGYKRLGFYPLPLSMILVFQKQ